MCSDPEGAGGSVTPPREPSTPQRRGVLLSGDQGCVSTPPGWTQGQASSAKTLHGQSLLRSGTLPGPDPGPRTP